MAKELVIAGVEIRPGERKEINIPVAKLYTDAEVSIPIQVIRAKKKDLWCLLALRFTGMSLTV